jgi:hypothetical protein
MNDKAWEGISMVGYFIVDELRIETNLFGTPGKPVS